MKIGIIGYSGKMGQALMDEISQNGDCRVLVSVVHSQNSEEIVDGIAVTSDFAEVVANCDVVIDFSRPEASLKVLEECIRQKKPLVSGTTGFTSTEMNIIRDASNKIKIFYSTNMSLGVAIMSDAIRSIIEKFVANNVAPEVSILDRHHKHKVDSPSGTALTLSKQITNYFDDIKVSIASLRYGSNIGEHEVILSTDRENLIIKHQAMDRRVFAAGAIAAAAFIYKQRDNGLYSMSDLVK